MSWEEFDAAYNGPSGMDISYDAYRLRKASLLKGQIQPVSEPERVIVPGLPVGLGPDGFVGIDIAFFDIETTFSNQPRVLYAAIADAWGRIERFSLYDERYAGKDPIDDSRLVDAYMRRLEQYDLLVGWNSRLFDVPSLNGRANYWRTKRDRGEDVDPSLRLLPLNARMHVDLMYKASGGHNRIGRRSLQSVSDYFESPHRKTPLSVRTWDAAVTGDLDAYQLIVDHCDADVLVLRDVFGYLKFHINSIHRAS